MTASPIRIAMADDQSLFSAGLKMILRSQPDMELVGEAVNGEAAVALVQSTGPDVLLMDIRMPLMDGITATRTILESSSGAATKIIVLTTIQHDEAVVRAIQAGAAGFLTKDTTPDFLLAAIRTVHSGHSVIAPAITNELLRDYTTPSSGNDAALADLSGRERDVFLLTAKGLGNAEIAASLVLSEATVKSHVGSILAKLKLKNRIQLVAFAYENNVLN
ncbi:MULTISPECIES: response regulator transcription factor [unclassified Arthrobacter]|uniref:response regulator transcription factor n=1 Tax=unclassified Arthrobacter TaxID=235627 RepID=UPI002DFF06C8|nr:MULTISPECIES: response regulator transcription factor [unclassified Arthrobacter]MEC5193451.1 DNA-binding NarL/FixJ family response regulator [Arthrobacter sp. MP_M4]MEC5204927.1 DNA-binding NarL/FixJ family response regulator [Arthrobacter sp. MP_M7]